jgi:DNA-binding FadR family transcriptional regulator
MPITIVEPRRLYREIATQLSGLIASGEFAVGSRLPSERDLAAQLGVSRPSLREALIALELEGLVEVRVGAGIWVTASSDLSTVKPIHEGEGPFELLRARWLVEGEIAAVAARAATVDELHGIRETVTAMARMERNRQDFSSADRDFHLRLAASTRNSVLAAMVQDLWDRGRGAMWSLMEQHFQTPALRAATIDDHHAILVALEAHDPRKARHAMRSHLRRVDTEFARGWALHKRPREAAAAEPARRRAPRKRAKAGR